MHVTKGYVQADGTPHDLDRKLIGVFKLLRHCSSSQQQTAKCLAGEYIVHTLRPLACLEARLTVNQLLCLCNCLLVIAANNDVVWVVSRRWILQKALHNNKYYISNLYANQYN